MNPAVQVPPQSSAGSEDAAAYDGGTTLTTPVLATLRVVEVEPAGTAVRLRDPEGWDGDEDEAPETFTALALTGSGLY